MWFAIEYNSINPGTSENIPCSNSSIQIWSTSKDLKASYVIKTGPTEKFLQNKKSIRISGPQLKIKYQFMAYGWTFKKDSAKSEKIL